METVKRIDFLLPSYGLFGVIGRTAETILKLFLDKDNLPY